MVSITKPIDGMIYEEGKTINIKLSDLKTPSFISLSLGGFTTEISWLHLTTVHLQASMMTFPRLSSFDGSVLVLATISR